MTTDYKVKFVQCLEPVLSSLSGADFSSIRQDPDDHAPTATATTPSSYRSVSKSLPATPKHRSTARVEFQTDFPEHCKMFDGHMKVCWNLKACSELAMIITQNIFKFEHKNVSLFHIIYFFKLSKFPQLTLSIGLNIKNITF